VWMLQLQRVGVSRLREPAADREGERETRMTGVSPCECVREWYTRPRVRVYRTRRKMRDGGGRSLPHVAVKVHTQGRQAGRQAGTHARTHACEYSRDTFTSLLASFARAPRAQNPMGARVKKGEREIGS